MGGRYDVPAARAIDRRLIAARRSLARLGSRRVLTGAAIAALPLPGEALVFCLRCRGRLLHHRAGSASAGAGLIRL